MGCWRYPNKPATRLSRVDAFQRILGLTALPDQVVMKVGSHAIGSCESGQVRKEAALSSHLYVPWGRLTGAHQSGGL